MAGWIPWVRVADFDAHVNDDTRVHAETSTSLSTILNEVRAGNELTRQLSDKVAPLDQIRSDLIAQVDDRKFRRRLVGTGKTLLTGVGWVAAFVGSIAAVAAVSPKFLTLLQWLLSLIWWSAGNGIGGTAG